VNLNAFIPLDRLQAITRDLTLPEQAYGSILIADISDFTPLTEAFVRVWGNKRGAEELTRQLNLIYDALIDKVYRYGGSVIGFSGDGITDTAGFDQQTDQWLVSLSNGSGFITSVGANGSPMAEWTNLQAGDFTGDGFNASLWATWNPDVAWVNVNVGDFDNDGQADITGMAL